MYRLALAVLLSAALAGCASVRKGLGEYQKAADKGITIGGPPVDAYDKTSADRGGGNGKRADLPAGLAGDKVHPAYTAPPQG